MSGIIRSISHIIRQIKTVNIQSKPISFSRLIVHSRCFSSDNQTNLMQFFDDEKNWSADEVKVGRSWTLDDLRIKSNEDLHKLWYVLLKEKNMLLTMEHACKEEVELFPNPERIDKVNESMDNLETVVRERNRAYFELETGESGERPTKQVHSLLGLPYTYKMAEHHIPQFMNSKWQKEYKFGYGGYAVFKFLRLLDEKNRRAKAAKIMRDKRRVARILSKFPNVDIEAVKEKFPDVDVDKVMLTKEARGNHMFNKN